MQGDALAALGLCLTSDAVVGAGNPFHAIIGTNVLKGVGTVSCIAQSVEGLFVIAPNI